MDNFILKYNIIAFYDIKNQSLIVRIGGKNIIETFVEEPSDFWCGFTYDGRMFDINLHDYNGVYTLQLYSVVDGEIDCSKWQNIQIVIK